MATLSTIDELLEPISPDQPAGEDLRWTAEWDRLREARRADDEVETGRWTRKEQKSSDWKLVNELARAMLSKRSKDLQLSMWLTEASIKLNGFAGLRDGLRLTNELINRFWDKGLFPVIEDGPQDRSGPFEWMNEKLAEPLLQIPLTASDLGEDFNLLQLRDARLVGAESSWKDPDGSVDIEKKKIFDKALAEGRRSYDMFRSALAGTKRSSYEDLSLQFSAAQAEYRELEKRIDEKFIDSAPSLKDFRTVINELSDEISRCLSEKRKQEPDAVVTANPRLAEASGERTEPFKIRLPLSGLADSPQTGTSGSWQNAERLVHAGQIDAGLAEMIRLAASETSGRSRFQRKFVLAEICLASNRRRLARTILEELAEQIDKFQLEQWETSDFIGGVWTNLFQIYASGDSSEKDRAGKLYDRLCRLDPWQALACVE